MTENLIEIRNLNKAFDSIQVLKDVSFDVPKGSVTVIIGPSGSGKTTLLRSINLLEIPDSGSVSVGASLVDFSNKPKPQEIAELATHSGMVFQANNLFPHLTALGNITLGPIKAQGKAKTEADAEARKLIEELGLAGLELRYPHQLSGGQQQRVGIARALALKPNVLLFDEPTSALDPELVGEVLRSIKTLAQFGWTMVIVTHEIRFAQKVADQVIFMDQGEVLEVGTPSKVLTKSTNERLRSFLNGILFS